MANRASDRPKWRQRSPLQLRLTRLRFALLLLLSVCFGSNLLAAPVATLDAIPAEVSSDHFRIAIAGGTAPVMHAAAGYYTSSIEASGPFTITITADDPHYWDAGVEVQPMRFGIRPARRGASITFTIPGPSKLSITRPGDHFGDSEMLFVFTNAPETAAPSPGTPHLRYYGPGVHHQNIDARTGDRIYLAPGAVVFGAINVWRVHDVHVSGRGTVIYDGPQDPDHDQGWMHKRNWHLIVMDKAHDISIAGIVGIVRSRTWMIQMRDSEQVQFTNVKIIGGSPGNANQDGMDWLGGGETVVRDSFFRAADDVFAMYGNWDGYEKRKLMRPGHAVRNILIEGSTLSTSISNIVRLGWPEKTFDSSGFTMRDSDVIHMGFGSCKVPFALFELWADPGGRGDHRDVHFENVRLEDWYSLAQVLQPNPAVRNVTFDDVWAMDGPGMTGSELKGDVSGVALHNVQLGRDGTVKIAAKGRATPAQLAHSAIGASFDSPAGLIRPGQPVRFRANGPDDPHRTYEWRFGDGSVAYGHDVTHAFPDTEGTLLDGSGRFRVLLHVTAEGTNSIWSSQSVVVSDRLQRALQSRTSDGSDLFVQIPRDGGYTFTLLTSRSESLQIDNLHVVPGPRPRPLVCGTPGSAIQPVRASAALAAGLHRIHVGAAESHDTDGAGSVLLWEGNGLPRSVVRAER